MPFDILFLSLVFSVMTPRVEVDGRLINVLDTGEKVLTAKLLKTILLKIFSSFLYMEEKLKVVIKVVLKVL